MHQSSMITSSELRRRIEPTGHPTMQSGSRHWRQEVATRYLSKRRPSRTRRRDAVVGIGAGAHALVATRAALEIENEQALRLHRALAREIDRLERSWLRTARRSVFSSLAFARRISRLLANLGKLLEHEAGNLRRRCAPLPHGRARCMSPMRRPPLSKRNFAEIPAARQVGQRPVRRPERCETFTKPMRTR